jgi:DNA-binding MarR family transcriptional regulator
MPQDTGMTKRMQRFRTFVGKPSQIRVLASAIRQDVLETVEALGSCTIKELAECLGRRPDALYYHVRVLSRAGFLNVDRTKSEVSVSVAKRAVQLRYDPGNRQNRAAVLAVVRAMLRGSQRGFARGFNESAVVTGPGRTLWAARVKAYLTPSQLAKANRLIEEMLALFQERTTSKAEGLELQEFTILLNPAANRRRRE